MLKLCRAASYHEHKPGHHKSDRCPIEVEKTSSHSDSLRHALAFAADQHAGHLMGCLARLGQIAVRSVPAGMIGIVTGGASFAGAALSTGGAVRSRFVRARCPIFVDIE